MSHQIGRMENIFFNDGIFSRSEKLLIGFFEFDGFFLVFTEIFFYFFVADVSVIYDYEIDNIFSEIFFQSLHKILHSKMSGFSVLGHNIAQINDFEIFSFFLFFSFGFLEYFTHSVGQ